MGLTILTDDGPNAPDFKKYHGAFLYAFPFTKGTVKTFKLQSVKMREIHDLLSSKESDEVAGLLNHECSFGIQFARRDKFSKKKRKNAKKKADEFKDAFKSQKIIRTLSLHNSGTTKIYPMVKSR